jgi:hypothetical protein
LRYQTYLDFLIKGLGTTAMGGKSGARENLITVYYSTKLGAMCLVFGRIFRFGVREVSSLADASKMENSLITSPAV